MDLKNAAMETESTSLLQLFKLLFDYDNFIARAQSNGLNEQTDFFFHCYASEISYIPTPDSHSQIVNLFYAVEYVLTSLF